MLLQYGGPVLAVADAIDPGLVPEVMWRLVAARTAPRNPRVGAPIPRCRLWSASPGTTGRSPPHSSSPRWRMDKISDAELLDWDWAFETWTLIDPRAAVARLEKIPMKSTNPNDNRLWIYVVEKLALNRDERWRKTFTHWEPIFNPHVRDFMLDRF
jgi:hypothetical protein